MPGTLLSGPVGPVGILKSLLSPSRLAALLLCGCLAAEYPDVSKDRCPGEPGLPEHNGCPSDADQDGMNDWWEKEKGLSLGVNDATLDSDGDGLTNVQEHAKDTNPNLADTDSDGVNDSLDACPKAAGDPAGNGCAP